MTQHDEDLEIVKEQESDATNAEPAGEQSGQTDEVDNDPSKKASDEAAELNRQIEEKDDQILRLSAEIQNMQRRFTKERSDAAKYRSQPLAENLIESLDNLERALQIEVGEDEAAQSLKKGIELVHQGLLKALAEEGVTVNDPKGEIFDPNFHQSVNSVPLAEGQQPEEVVEVYQKGYVIKDRVIRPAMVVIAQ